MLRTFYIKHRRLRLDLDAMNQSQLDHVEAAIRATNSWCVDACIELLHQLTITTPEDIVFLPSMGHLQLVARKAAYEVL